MTFPQVIFHQAASPQVHSLFDSLGQLHQGLDDYSVKNISSHVTFPQVTLSNNIFQ